MADDEGESFIERALRLNRTRRESRHADAARAGAAWLVECRDLWDSPDEDQGVYFVACKTEADVAALVEPLDDDNPNDRVLGIYRVRDPVIPQGPGLTRQQWLAGMR